MMQHFLRFLAAQFHGNQFVSGGAVLMAAGAVWASLRSPCQQLWAWLRSQAFVYIEVTNADPLFHHLQQWLADHPRAGRFRMLQGSTERLDWGTGSPPSDGAAVTQGRILFSPAPGTHVLVHRGRLVWIWRERHEQAQTRGASWKETLYLRVFTRDPAFARRLVQEAMDRALQPRKSETKVWVNTGDYWGLAARRAARHPESVILPDGQMEAVLADCREFLASEDWYAGMGLPYRRGYLLEGRPGTGKSSVVLAVASELGVGVRVLTLATNTLTDAALAGLVRSVPPGDILLLEDVDAAGVDREPGSYYGVTLSGLLNVLDGVAAPDGRLLFMTTNHAEKLDPALVRPGRVDRRVAFGYATEPQAARLFLRFFPGQASLAARFAARAAGYPRTMAEIQQVLLANRSDSRAAVSALSGVTILCDPQGLNGGEPKQEPAPAGGVA